MSTRLENLVEERGGQIVAALDRLTEAVRAASVPGLEHLSFQQRIELAKTLLKGTIEEGRLDHP